MKKIIMVSQTVFPPDIRLEKEIRTLAKAGYNITVVCNQFEKGKSPGFEYCKIVRIKAIFKSTKLNKILNFPLFLNPRYLFTFFKTMVKVKPDFIHAHDLPMAPLGLFFGKLFGKPVISDMHENYPAALQAFQKKGLLNFLFKNYRFAKILEKMCIKLSDMILVVVEENKERLVKLGVKQDKVFVVSNTVDLNTFKTDLKYDKNLNEDLIRRKIVLYTGTVSPERDLITPILGMQYLDDNESDLIFLIVGEGPQKMYLKHLVQEKNLSKKVAFMDWPGHDYIPSLIEASVICTIPQPSNEFINTTIPHKLFEYMAMSKPVLTSDAEPFKRIIEETGAGMVFKSEDPQDFSETLTKMIKFPEEWGIKGRKAVEKKYNWDKDSLNLLKLYDSFLK